MISVVVFTEGKKGINVFLEILEEILHVGKLGVHYRKR
jgi:hypothetical protein